MDGQIFILDYSMDFLHQDSHVGWKSTTSWFIIPSGPIHHIHPPEAGLRLAPLLHRQGADRAARGAHVAHAKPHGGPGYPLVI